MYATHMYYAHVCWGHKSQMFITSKITKVYLQNMYVRVCVVSYFARHKRNPKFGNLD